MKMQATVGGWFRALAWGLAAAAIANAALAQSTMQQIKQKGELRIGVTPGEPWYFKDPGSGQWSGIGYAMINNNLGQMDRRMIEEMIEAIVRGFKN